MSKDYSHITLLVDMDDTIENLLPAWAEWLNKKHGTSVKTDDITGWDVQKFFPSLSKDEVYAPLYEDEFWGTVQPKEDAIHHLSRINELGFKLYISIKQYVASWNTSSIDTSRLFLGGMLSRYVASNSSMLTFWWTTAYIIFLAVRTKRF